MMKELRNEVKTEKGKEKIGLITVVYRVSIVRAMASYRQLSVAR